MSWAETKYVISSAKANTKALGWQNWEIAAQNPIFIKLLEPS